MGFDTRHFLLLFFKIEASLIEVAGMAAERALAVPVVVVGVEEDESEAAGGLDAEACKAETNA